MPNNFRLTGDIYVSKEGNDANSGLTPELPKLTVQAAFNLVTTISRTIVIGTGVYQEAISWTSSSVITITVVSDGQVIFMGNGNNFFSLTPANSITHNLIGIEFVNYQYLNLYQNAGTATYNLISCTVKSPIFTTTTNNINQNFSRCLFLNSFFNLQNTGAVGTTITLDKCILINTSILSNNVTPSVGVAPSVTQFINSYLDATSIISLRSTITTTLFNFNNIQGKIIMNTGTYAGIALSFADHRTFYPTFNVQSISANPKFNDVQNLNFTLQSDSPHIRAASDFISNIGGTEYAVYKAATDAVFSGGTITNLSLNANAYTISSGTSGNIVTTPIAVQSFPATKPLTGILLHGDLQFNKSITAGTSGNQNVPAYDTYTTGGGASPDRLKIKMRYSTQSASPTSGQWDNGGYAAADSWILVEVNAKPKVDSNGVGNGDFTYLEFSGLGDLVPTWIQLDIKLRNDYNP